MGPGTLSVVGQKKDKRLDRVEGRSSQAEISQGRGEADQELARQVKHPDAPYEPNATRA